MQIIERDEEPRLSEITINSLVDGLSRIDYDNDEVQTSKERAVELATKSIYKIGFLKAYDKVNEMDKDLTIKGILDIDGGSIIDFFWKQLGELPDATFITPDILIHNNRVYTREGLYFTIQEFDTLFYYYHHGKKGVLYNYLGLRIRDGIVLNAELHISKSTIVNEEYHNRAEKLPCD